MTARKYLVVVRGTRALSPDPFDIDALRRRVPGLRHAALNLAEPPVDAVGAGPLAPLSIRAVLALWMEGDNGHDGDPRTGCDGPLDGGHHTEVLAASLDWPAVVYPVIEQVHWGRAPAAALGVRLPGVKRMALVQRNPQLTPQQFADHWAQVHAPLAALHHPTLAQYSQNVVSARPSSGAPVVAGVAELRFRSAEDYLQRRYDSKAGEAVLRRDVARFLAPVGSQSVWVGEYPLL